MVIAWDAWARAVPYTLGMSAVPEWPSGPLVHEIAGVLRERIIERRDAAEAPLSRRALAKVLTVARGVVGEALRLLRREGLVDITRVGATTRVAAADRWVFLSACAVREIIDGLAARRASRRPRDSAKVRSGAGGAAHSGRQAIPEHEAIPAAVSRGDAEQAERAARAHLRATIETLEQVCDGR
jgi:DNA-binding GntR family transcriptional regulator